MNSSDQITQKDQALLLLSDVNASETALNSWFRDGEQQDSTKKTKALQMCALNAISHMESFKTLMESFKTLPEGACGVNPQDSTSELVGKINEIYTRAMSHLTPAEKLEVQDKATTYGKVEILKEMEFEKNPATNTHASLSSDNTSSAGSSHGVARAASGSSSRAAASPPATYGSIEDLRQAFRNLENKSNAANKQPPRSKTLYCTRISSAALLFRGICRGFTGLTEEDKAEVTSMMNEAGKIHASLSSDNTSSAGSHGVAGAAPGSSNRAAASPPAAYGSIEDLRQAFRNLENKSNAANKQPSTSKTLYCIGISSAALLFRGICRGFTGLTEEDKAEVTSMMNEAGKIHASLSSDNTSSASSHGVARAASRSSNRAAASPPATYGSIEDLRQAFRNLEDKSNAANEQPSTSKTLYCIGISSEALSFRGICREFTGLTEGDKAEVTSMMNEAGKIRENLLALTRGELHQVPIRSRPTPLNPTPRTWYQVISDVFFNVVEKVRSFVSSVISGLWNFLTGHQTID